MSAGTLKLTNGSTAVTGTGTTFTADMTAADVAVVTVGGTVYSLAVDSVTSDTALELSLPFTGPTTTGVAWQAVPRKTMLRVTAELNKQVTEALRVANENAINWQAVLSSPDTVNVLLPDGTTLTGFSWRKINDLLNALDVDHLDATASQIHTDAQQVATDKPIIVQAKTDAIAAKTAAVNAKGDAETAKTASETAQGKSEAAQAKSETAQAAAEAAASSVHPENLLHKDQNLGDLSDRAAAWLNVRPDGATPLAADPIAPLDSATMGWVKTFIASVRSVLSSWSVINAITTAPVNGTTTKGGALRSALNVGGAEYAAAEFQTSVVSSSSGVKTVGAEIVLKDSTSGTVTNKTIKLGTVDGLASGTISGTTLSLAGAAGSGFTGIDVSNTAPDSVGGFYNVTLFGTYRGGMEVANEGSYGFSTKLTFSRNTNVTGDHRELGFAIYSNGATWLVSQPTYGSDERLKSNIKDIGSARDELRTLRTSRYVMDGREQIGLIAQDVRPHWPELVDSFEKVTYDEIGAKHSERYMSLNYTGMIAPTIKAVNENSDLIDKMMKKIEALEYELKKLKGG
ncbi:tail fiber domain-containing protein [Kluyvera sichuanensis]|uniref:tail fiber domain-containing protein n=1 Tax=Kluyvera sichuanensis TaxID=2725494 RepID=UPI0039F51E5D